MHPLRKQLAKVPAVKALSSVKITVVCLGLLFILTFWGTIDQVTNGLYLAQERFFNSLIFTFWGFLPFPGARLVLWVLFVNLVCVSLVRLVYRWSKVGIIIIHGGLLLFFAAAFVTFHGVEESNITLMEGEGADVASAYHNWELSVWTQDGPAKNVIAFDVGDLREGDVLDFGRYGFTAIIKSYFRNCEAYRSAESGHHGETVNISGIQSLKPAALNKEPGKNLPGMTFALQGADQGNLNILLFGGESNPLPVVKDGKTYYMMLRHKRYPLPFVLRLKDFMMETHPNTQTARTYKSLVEVTTGGASRDVLISMNNPLRYKNFTFYQASYAIDALGREFSTLAVVKNSGRLLPYIATFTTFAGLVTHLFMMTFQPKLKPRRKRR